ncbi:uncharacterized protein M6G45_004913 isoform 2-T3 [Spheniscus humboldti]
MCNVFPARECCVLHSGLVPLSEQRYCKDQRKKGEKGYLPYFLFVIHTVLDCDMKLHQHKFGEPSIQKIELLMKNVLHSGKDGYIQEEDLSKSQLQYLKTGV